MSYGIRVCAMLLCLLGLTSPCRAQSAAPTTLELDMDGRSRVDAASRGGTQMSSTALRLETDLGSGLRLVAWGARTPDQDSLQQALIEKDAGAQRLQLGIVRLPFGLYDSRETYASGLIDYPLARGDDSGSSVDWGVPGVQVSGGTPSLQFEAAGFDGRAAGVWTSRRAGGGAVRVQTFARDLILGASRWDGFLGSDYETGARAPVQMNGLDLRYTRPQLLIRGEYLFGALGGEQMHGWYVDLYYRLPQRERITLVGRLEQLRPGSDDPMARQVTIGVRFVATPQWMVAVNWRRHDGASSPYSSGPSYTGRGSDVLLQVYRKVTL